MEIIVKTVLWFGFMCAAGALVMGLFPIIIGIHISFWHAFVFAVIMDVICDLNYGLRTPVK